MSLYDRILVPTDGSAEGRAGGRTRPGPRIGPRRGRARAVRGRHGELRGDADGDLVGGVGDLLRDDANKAVAEVESLAAETDLHVETGVAEGSPSKEIIRYAEDNGCDLIVMGTHGRGGIDRLLPRERRREGGPRVERSRVDGAAGR